MKILFKKTNQIIQEISRIIHKNITGIIEEFRTILRNKNYSSRYPHFFAIFAIIEHEQNPQVFDFNHADFNKIKIDILKNKETNNHQILEALRGLFQNSNLPDEQNNVRIKITKYLFEEIKILIDLNNRYYVPLMKALLRGFPFLLNYNNYALCKKLLQQKSKMSLKLIKHILDDKNFPNFFVNNDDAVKILLDAHEINNKPAFMLLMRYLRNENLFSALFGAGYFAAKTKIIDAVKIAQKGVDYAAIALSYCEDQWFDNTNSLLKPALEPQGLFGYQGQQHKQHTYLSLFRCGLAR